MNDQTSTDTPYIRETDEEPRMPGHESEMERKPEWRPRFPGSGRLKDKVAIVTGADSGIGPRCRCPLRPRGGKGLHFLSRGA